VNASPQLGDLGGDLATMLDLEEIEANLFRGHSPVAGWQRVFGGLVVAQALVAATRTVGARPAHSLHSYFILPGDPEVPIVYQVERIRDGRSFATRRCSAIQHGRIIFSLMASFHAEEPGPEYARAMPDVPAPETLPSEAEILREMGANLPEGVKRWMERKRPIELRPVSLDRFLRREDGAYPQYIWVRAKSALPDDPALHRAVLAYLSDMTLLDAALVVHHASVFDARFQSASLDHAIWFHRPARADQWLLYVQDSANSGSARGLAHGLLYAQDGTLVASVAQEGLVRPRDPASAAAR
jgi:acyl-CoA thioesterase-2